MRIVVLAATHRGYLFVQKLTELAPQCDLVVFSFPEEPWEPPFLAKIRELTLNRGGKFFEARQVGSPKWNEFWESTPIDLMFAVSWRFMVPAKVYQRPRLGTFVFHDSLLPTYRGFSPTVWSIINGEDHTGVTLFEIADGVDEGDIIAQQSVPIAPDDTIAVVMERVTQTYLDILAQNLENLLMNKVLRHPQNHDLATYTCKRLPEDNRIDWTAPTAAIFNLIRATTAPYPGAYAYLGDQKLRVWSAKRLLNARHYVGAIPGRVVEIQSGKGAIVLTGDGSILLTKVQLEAGEIVCAADVLNRISYTLT
jgi:UDP-4-amino-4-deoxy-L-arabinose formyltransferase/UDP-glucuronic acid dehydrogenase (UDP-4-keto-hexauronic acid decarboxylating)